MRALIILFSFFHTAKTSTVHQTLIPSNSCEAPTEINSSLALRFPLEVALRFSMPTKQAQALKHRTGEDLCYFFFLWGGGRFCQGLR